MAKEKHTGKMVKQSVRKLKGKPSGRPDAWLDQGIGLQRDAG